MPNRKKIKTTKKQIVAYWADHVSEAGLSIDFSEAQERCWRCGCQRSLERCHIVPDSLGGADTASNLVLLCKRCHLDNPNTAGPEIMWGTGCTRMQSPFMILSGPYRAWKSIKRSTPSLSPTN